MILNLLPRIQHNFMKWAWYDYSFFTTLLRSLDRWVANPICPALWRPVQEDWEFKNRLSYSLRPFYIEMKIERQSLFATLALGWLGYLLYLTEYDKSEFCNSQSERWHYFCRLSLGMLLPALRMSYHAKVQDPSPYEKQKASPCWLPQ